MSIVTLKNHPGVRDIFVETITNLIAAHGTARLDPQWMKVEGFYEHFPEIAREKGWTYEEVNGIPTFSPTPS